jgi:hypothetical protein
MTFQEFANQIELLKATYGDKAYPEPRTKRIWAWAKKTNVELFKAAVQNAIGDCERAPLLAKLKEFYTEIRNKSPEKDKIPCDFCDGGGWICDDQPLPTAYACRCENGMQIPEQYKRFESLGLPFKRIVPRPNELMKAATVTIVNSTFGGPTIDEMRKRRDDMEKQIIDSERGQE